MSTSSCSGSLDLDSCRDDKTALILKIVAIASIFLAGALGVSVPLVGKKWRLLKSDSSFFFAIKAFAAGVILATGFVHMLPDATSALSNPCLAKTPWSTFPFAGLIAMMAALTTLLADFISTQYYETKEKKQIQTQIEPDDLDFASVVVPLVVKDGGADVDCGGIHIIGVDGQNGQMHNHSETHSHSHAFGDYTDSVARNVVISQVLELGIVSHSIIIGLSLGVSQSPCTIRPLLGALSFHQFFEGFALGGCISEARFGVLRSTIMACFFAVTTPISVGIGICISSFYNPDSPRALVIEGVLDSISAGILVYMALVDLIAAEFLSKRMGSKLGDQIVSFIALFLGAGLGGVWHCVAEVRWEQEALLRLKSVWQISGQEALLGILRLSGSDLEKHRKAGFSKITSAKSLLPSKHNPKHTLNGFSCSLGLEIPNVINI